MISRRDLTVAILASAATVALVAAGSADSHVMGSRAITWESLTAQPTKVGAVRKVFQEPTATLDELEMHITTLNPGETPHPPHTHPDEELVIIKEGTVDSVVNGRTERLGPGGIIFQASNQPHSIKNVGTTPATYYVVKWNSPGMLKARQTAAEQSAAPKP
jgi:XRE family transcriptional regulator, regulator of sulfur utilization